VGSDERSQAFSAVCGLLAGPVLFVATAAAVLAQPDDFSVINHENSDLGAETANSAWLANQLGSNLPGVLVLVFAIGLWRSLGRHPSARIGSSLVGAAGVGIFLSGFFRLDCRHIDRGCDQVSSWHAVAHNIDGGFTVLALVLAPFVLLRALKLAPHWRDLWVPTLAFGIGTIVAAIAGGAVGDGLASLLGVLVWFAWITVLAVRMFRLSGAPRTGPAARSLAAP
jgi:hypothetical membrane protein